MPKFSEQRKSLLSSQARVQVPWIKVTIGTYTFGVFSNVTRGKGVNKDGFYDVYNVQYPNYIQSLNVVKINGQVNQYTLTIKYPVTQFDDPNFFEKVFSSVSQTRKIVFSYGDASMPSYIYKDEEAIITDISSSFILESSVISYVVKAVSGAALKTATNMSFISDGQPHKPSDLIKDLFNNRATGLQDVFKGMNSKNLNKLINGSDQYVVLDTKLNISALDYISYLVSCMIPDGSTTSDISRDIFILTIHDDTTYDKLYVDEYVPYGGPYFKVSRTSYLSEQSDAYEVDIGYNTATIVTSFNVDNNENYSILYNYQKKINPAEYVRRINKKGEWEEVYAPATTSNNEEYETRPEDKSWWTKVTKYPISATITIQGLLRPATLMTYLRLNTIFPGGHKHISSGLYIITKQVDQIDGSGYRTTLSLTKISGDNQPSVNASSPNPKASMWGNGNF